MVEAGIAALDGRTDDALARYGDALRGWADLGITFEEAMTGLDMATLLDPTIPRVRAAAERARAIFAGLRATRLLELLDEATGRATSPEASSTGAPSQADGASSRAERAVRRPS